MKFDCGLTSSEKEELKKQKRENWHDWFAWYPVRVGHRDCRWLETIERKKELVDWYGYVYFYTQYRAKSS